MAGSALGAAALTCTGLTLAAFSQPVPPEIQRIQTTYGEEKGMNDKILVTYASRAGSTAGVADAIGKTLADVAAGWGFYWNGSVAYGLIGFVSGLVRITFPELRYPRNILRAILWGALGIFLAAIFLSMSASFLGDVDLVSAFRAFFWPEFAGNLVVVIIFLPLFAPSTIRPSMP